MEQVPSKSVRGALFPLVKALINNKLLRHAKMDVKVSVVSCIIEITRITAPDAPYKDEQMKEIFYLIVAAFENMSHVSTHSYKKVTSILDIIAKVMLCLVMLDLECDALVVISIIQDTVKKSAASWKGKEKKLQCVCVCEREQRKAMCFFFSR